MSGSVESIDYAIEPALTAAEFRAVLIASTLGERRPVDDLGRLERMLRGAEVIATARDRGRLVGVSRAVSDFAYCCYLADLAVDAAYQRRGIGGRGLLPEDRPEALPELLGNSAQPLSARRNLKVRRRAASGTRRSCP